MARFYARVAAPFTQRIAVLARFDPSQGPDLVIADETNGAVQTLLNKGNGTFNGSTSSKPACDLAREVVVGKLNRARRRTCSSTAAAATTAP